MTTKTDNYRELIRAAINHKCQCCADGGYGSNCSCDEQHLLDAIDALIKERDTVAKWRDIFDKQASGLFMECWEQKTNNRILARENERLREALAEAAEIVEAYERNNFGIRDLREPFEQFVQAKFWLQGAWLVATRAVLANAPTPNDKGK